ncbi:MAG: leucine--tRNA ligase [Nanoarchaeota archaeon]|nr:leucine--tRNA ligase [Nanoarchaeota archaeon]
MEYNFKAIESKWQKEWEKKKVFEVKEQKGKKKFYVLEMYPYPSSSGLHMGHALNYTIGDICARFKRMNGFNVLYPMGFDSFGLPAENAAIKAKAHPKKFTEDAIKNYIRQMKEIGLSYDWSRTFASHDFNYYKWNQYFFLKFLEKGLVYRKKAPVNFCRKCESVLANEQVHNGRCWRHEDTEVEIKQLEQWFIKTTKYAEELLKDIENLNWPERIKIMQRNWIGKSHGTEIDFTIDDKSWKIFTTRPDTIFGVTFMVVSAQHLKLMELVTNGQKKDVEKFLKKIKSVSEKEQEEMEKEGVFTGSYAVNPISNEKIPVYAGNFVVADYGSGMVMAVPGHDQRDFEFAKKYQISIKEVIKGENSSIKERAYVNEGVLVNSGKFNGMQSEKAKEEITKYLESKKIGRKKIEYKLKDWLVSRQRYWGTPIPVIYCEKCGIVPVNEKELPVLLPEKVTFGKGNPLTTNEKFVNVKCPKCKGKARRETDTMDTFFDSSWYFLRYCDNKNNKKPFDSAKANYWMPVDQYIGGAEHACMHLIYARFFTKALKDLGFVKIDEPFSKLFNQGMLLGSDGEKMSKSKGNVILPEQVSSKYGIDTARLFLVSVASPDKEVLWSENGIEGSLRFVRKVFDFAEKGKFAQTNKVVESKLNKAIKEITEDIEKFRYNLVVIKLRSLFDSIIEKGVSKKDFEACLKLLAPFCPHIAEEIWHKFGNKSFVSLEKWPEAGKVDENLLKQEENVDKLIDDINNVAKLVKEKQGKEVSKVYVYVIPNEKQGFVNNKNIIEKKTNLAVEIYAVNDKDKHDPQNFSKKAKPGRPALFLE